MELPEDLKGLGGREGRAAGGPPRELLEQVLAKMVRVSEGLEAVEAVLEAGARRGPAGRPPLTLEALDEAIAREGGLGGAH